MIMNNPNLENLLRNVLQAQGTIKETFIDTYLRKTGCKISECALVEKTDMDEGVIKYWVEKRSDMELAEYTPQINKDLLAACEKQKEAIDMLMAMLSTAPTALIGYTATLIFLPAGGHC